MKRIDLKKKFERKEKGSITVFLALILVSILMITLALLEGARLYAAKGYAKSVTALAKESILGNYCRELFEDYAILFYHGDAQETALECIRQNMGPEAKQVLETDLYQIRSVSADIAQTKTALDENGDLFLNQVVAYMRIKMPVDAVKKVTEMVTKYRTAEKEKVEENARKQEDVKEKLGTLPTEAINAIWKVKNTKGNLRQYLDILADPECSAQNAKKTYRNLRLYVKKIEPLLQDASLKLAEYQRNVKEYTKESENKLLANRQILDRLSTAVKESKQVLAYSSKQIQEHMKKPNPDIAKAIYDARKAAALASTDQLWMLEEGKQQKTVIDHVKDLLKNGKLALVVEDIEKISDASVTVKGLPSNGDYTKKQKVTLSSQVYFSQYVCDYMGCYTEKKENTALKYETEYILNGKESDRDNLSATVDSLVVLREAMNFVTIFKTPAYHEQCQALAVSIAGWTGIVPLISATKYLVMASWALGESVLDVKVLLKGQKVPLVKGEQDMQIGLSGLEQLGKNTKTQEKGKGLSYKEYLQLLLMLNNNRQIVYRTMDIIELNLNKRYGSFAFQNCIAEGELQTGFEISSVFWHIPLGKEQIVTEKFTYFQK